MKKKRNELVDMVVELMKGGKSINYITKKLHEKVNGVDCVKEVEGVINEACLLIENEHDTEKSNIVRLHVQRYNNDISRLLATQELDQKDIGSKITYEQWLSSRNRKIKAYDKALDTMAALQNVLNLTSENLTTVDVSHNVEINTSTDEKPKLNIDKLTFDEKVELLRLMHLCKVGENEIQSITDAPNDENQVLKDIHYEVIEPANIEHIQQTKLETIEEKTIVVDPISKLKETLKKIAAREMQRIGGNLDDTEKELLKDYHKN